MLEVCSASPRKIEDSTTAYTPSGLLHKIINKETANNYNININEKSMVCVCRFNVFI